MLLIGQSRCGIQEGRWVERRKEATMGWIENEWVENARCEDAPCCGCCGPHGDGDDGGDINYDRLAERMDYRDFEDLMDRDEP
jgi:hypothetical protein